MDAEEADGVALELLTFGVVALHNRQADDDMPLKTERERPARHLQDRSLLCVEATVERQKRLVLKRDDCSFLRLLQNS